MNKPAPEFNALWRMSRHGSAQTAICMPPPLSRPHRDIISNECVVKIEPRVSVCHEINAKADLSAAE